MDLVKFNHHPKVPGVWVPFNGQRFKMFYDIKLKTGEVKLWVYPNGGGFGNPEGNWRDAEVDELKLCGPDEYEDHILRYDGLEDFIEDCLRHTSDDELPDSVKDSNGNDVNVRIENV